MLRNLTIKQGLTYSIKTIPDVVRNESLLHRKGNTLHIRFYYSGTDCGLTTADLGKSYEIQFSFDDAYLELFKTATVTLSLSQFPLIEQQDNCCSTQLLLHELVTAKVEGLQELLLLESKALALLLCFQKEASATDTVCDSCKFLSKPLEKEKFYTAREILLNQLNEPPTIPELAMKIGINQCYLKKGFKELFGSTVYDFVQEQRMLKARLLLTTTDLSIAQVAAEIGFTSSGNFSTAFKRITGVFPSELAAN